jgi:hypothetical protein
VGSAIRLADLAHFKTRVEAASGQDGVDEDVSGAYGGDTTAADYAGPSTLGSFKVNSLNQERSWQLKLINDQHRH